jgi:acetyl esterase/lipase
VYREVLKTYRPASIGLYGCSAGGLLTAQAVAWFYRENLPAPGAIGVFCAGLGGFFIGDSPILGGPLNGMLRPMPARPPANSESANAPASAFGYLASVARTNPLAYPLHSPELLAKFPPTLFVSATRGFEFSAALGSHNALAKAGVESRFFAWDGLNHGFFYNSELPESRDAYDIMVQFFDDHLAKPEAGN